MASVSFVDGDSVKRFVDVSGAGTSIDPYIFNFQTPQGVRIPIEIDSNNSTIKIRDGSTTNTLSIDSNGRVTVSYTDETPAASPTATSGFIGLLRGFWNSIGLSSESSSSTGSIHAKLRFLIADTIGTTSSVVDVAGTLMGRLRAIAQSHAAANVFVRWGTSVVDTISGTPARVTKVYVWNKSTSIRYIQLFNRTTNPTTGTVPLVSYVLAPGEKYTLGVADLGSNDGMSFSTGLAWAFSTTEATYTAGTTTDVSVEIHWRSL
jgi:hypothetical protein